MRLAVLALAFSFLALPAAPALDKKGILKIAKEPHSRKNLVPELKVFADGREYAVEFEMTPVGGEPVEVEFTARDKVVDGRYLVSIFRPPGAPNNIYSVVEFDRKASLYRKWVFVPDGRDGIIAESTGRAARGSRTISWVSRNDPANRIEAVERHHDNGATWTETHYQGNEVVRRAKGNARKTK